jgi:hypothetical protein
MTGARRHSCKQVGINKALELLKNPNNPELYFVVPEDRFETFTYQNYQGTDGHVLQQPSVKIQKLKQFALEIKLISKKNT